MISESLRAVVAWSVCQGKLHLVSPNLGREAFFAPSSSSTPH